VSREPPRALRGTALRDALVQLGFDGQIDAPLEGHGTVVELPRGGLLSAEVALVDAGPPPSTDPPQALVGDDLRRALDALAR
jgi:hypothetical protein